MCRCQWTKKPGKKNFFLFFIRGVFENCVCIIIIFGETRSIWTEIVNNYIVVPINEWIFYIVIIVTVDFTLSPTCLFRFPQNSSHYLSINSHHLQGIYIHVCTHVYVNDFMHTWMNEWIYGLLNVWVNAWLLTLEIRAVLGRLPVRSVLCFFFLQISLYLAGSCFLKWSNCSFLSELVCRSCLLSLWLAELSFRLSLASTFSYSFASLAFILYLYLCLVEIVFIP